MNRLECPYCKYLMDDPDDCYEQDRVYEWQCEDCEKYFCFTIEYSRLYYERKAPCLNGEPHKYQMTTTYPRKYSKMECVDCGDRRAPTQKEFEDAGITEREE